MPCPEDVAWAARSARPVRGSVVVRYLVSPVTLCGSREVFFVAASGQIWLIADRDQQSRAGRAAETEVVLFDAASDDLVTMDAWEPDVKIGIRAGAIASLAHIGRQSGFQDTRRSGGLRKTRPRGVAGYRSSSCSRGSRPRSVSTAIRASRRAR